MQAPHPARVARATEKWFVRHQRPLPWRDGYDPYHVWISEVMLQQTRMEVVLPYFERFVARFPTVESLAAASLDQVMAAWSGLGYYRRARMLHEGARVVAGPLGGVVPSTVEELLTIPGIGRYTAGAIASIAWNRPAPIVDGNVARIVARLFGIDQPTGSAALMREAWRRAEELVAACRTPRSFNQGLMEIGALICRPRKPDCPACPLKAICAAHRSGRTEALPRPKGSQPVKQLLIPLYLIADGEGRLLMNREEGPLMTAMYHLPHGATTLLQAPTPQVAGREHVGSFVHTITNRRVEFQIYNATLDGIRESPGNWEWIDPRTLGDLPHPSYVKKALDLAGVTRADTRLLHRG